MRLLRAATLALTTVVATAGDGHAWGPDGHRIIAEIAFKLLPPQKAAKFDQLLRGSLGVGYLEASHYADLVIRPLEPETERWHYVNWTITTPYSDEFCRGTDKKLTCILEQLPIQIRAAGTLTAANPNDPNVKVPTDPNVRAKAISWIIHLVADLHQPLHIGDNADNGGNKFFVRYRGRSMCGPPAFPLAITGVNLHRVWDHCLVYDLIDGRDWSNVADEIRGGLVTYKGQAAAVGDYKDWTKQTHDLARDVAYQGISLNDDLGAPYIVRALAAVREQLLRAGIRLARVLDEIE